MPRSKALPAFIAVLACSWGAPPAEAGNPLIHNGSAYLAADGVTSWKTPDGPRWATPKEPVESLLATDGARIFLAGGTGIRALRLEDGQGIWTTPLTGRTFEPVFEGGRLFVTTTEGRLIALNPATGDPLWQRRFEGWVYPPAVAADTLITGGQAGKLWGLDPATGRTRWTRSLGQQLVSGPTPEPGGGVLIPTFDAVLTHIDPATGETRWARRLATPLIEILATRNQVIGSGYDRAIYALAPDSGKALWSTELAERPADLLALSEKRLAVTDASGGLYLLDRADGRILGKSRLPQDRIGGPALWGDHLTLFLNTNGQPQPWRPDLAYNPQPQP